MLIFHIGAIAILSATFAIPLLPVRVNSQVVESRTKQQQQIYALLDRCQPALSQRVGSRILIDINTLQDFFISNTLNGLSGQGSLDAAGGFRQFTFECSVNIRDGRVTGLLTRFVDDSSSNFNPPINPPSDNAITAIVNMPNGQPIPLRFGPGTEYFEVRRVPNGGSIQLNGEVNGNWVQTVDEAWVYRPYLRIIR